MTDLLKIKGLGVKSAENLLHLNIASQQDLLLHLPFRYQNKTKISSLSHAKVNEEVLVGLTIINTVTIKDQFLCKLVDDNNTTITWRFFNYSQYMRQKFVRNHKVEGFGELKITRNGLEMFHPEYSLLSLGQKPLLRDNFTPIYHLSSGISQNNLQKWIQFAISNFNDNNKDSKFKRAINLIHNPHKTDDIDAISNFSHPAQEYLILEELATRKLIMLKAREQIKKQKSYKLTSNDDEIKQLNLKFNLTKSQKQAVKDIAKDLALNKPMRRLLQGDVGCGKTIVAVLAALIAINNNKQVVVMVPTTLLAKQHFAVFSSYLQHLAINIVLLISKQNNKDRQQAIKMIAGDTNLIIGTHALLAEEVQFRELALVIIDEQHKFGVEQRIELNDKAKTNPHQLLISATPIPRSIVMHLYGELDVSLINEMPTNRGTITTSVLNIKKKSQLINSVKIICGEGKQVYWVCALIEENDNYNANAATKTYNELQQLLPDINIGLIHSKINKKDKQSAMEAFKRNELQILISTTVIEVGVDVPNAVCMVVENAEKMGLANLHQLRGRVGRGTHNSNCILLYEEPLTANAKQRLNILRSTTDGFIIANEDLRLRGAGEILGTSQSGLTIFKIADIVRDTHLMGKANSIAKNLFVSDVVAQNALIARWVSNDLKKYIIS